MGNTACTHGMPSRASCVDCMFEQGLGAKVPKVHRGIYARCVELARQGTSDVSIPRLVAKELNDIERRELVTVGLRFYAAQARRTADSEARHAALRANPVPKGEGKAAAANLKRVARAMGVAVDVASRYMDGAFLASEIALGDGRRVARGNLTVADVESKLSQLERQRDGVQTTIEDYEQHLAVLRRTKAGTLYEAVGHDAAAA
jgi:hypothetical protein